MPKDLPKSRTFGFDQSGELMAVELPSGKRLWETPDPVSKRPFGSGTAFIFQNGDRFFLFNELGDLILARLSRDGYEELGRFHVLEPTNVAFGRCPGQSAVSCRSTCTTNVLMVSCFAPTIVPIGQVRAARV